MSEHPPSGNGVPRHPDVHVEPKDVAAGGVLGFIAGVAILLAVSMAGLFVLLVWLNVRTAGEKPGALPLASQEQREFRERTKAPVPQPLPEEKTGRWRDANEAEQGNPRSRLTDLPRLEGIDILHPEHTTGRLYESTAVEQRRRQEEWLNGGGEYRVLIDGKEQATRRRVPITEAMERLAKAKVGRTGPVPEEEWLRAPTRASSGRVGAAGTNGTGGAP
jgi:hypothetical protein